MKYTIVTGGILLALLAGTVVLWRVDKVNERADILKANVEDAALSWYISYGLESSLARVIFLGGKEGLDVPQPQDMAEFVALRLQYWQEQGRIPEIVKGLYLQSDGETWFFDFKNGSKKPVGEEILQPFFSNIVEEREPQGGYLYYPLIRRGSPSPYFAHRSSDGSMVLELDETVLTEQLLMALRSEQPFEELNKHRFWSIAVEWHHSTEIAEIETNQNVLGFALTTTFQNDPQRFESMSQSIPAELQSLQELLAILGYRGDQEEPALSYADRAIEGNSLWLMLHIDPKRLIIEAIIYEFGQLFLTFVSLTLIIVIAVILIKAVQRSRRQIEEQNGFIASVTHELRSPLGVIRNAAANISDGVVTDKDKIQRYGQLIQREGQRLTRMVDSVLLYSGFLAGQQNQELVSLDAWLPTVLEPIELMCQEQGILFHVSVPKSFTFVGDLDGMSAALGNLLRNGVIHGGHGHYLSLEIHAREKRVCFVVTDHGRGISELERRRIFHPFIRGQRSIQERIPGSGLGLALVERIAHAHGGWVELSNTEEGGACFTLVIKNDGEKS
ncbi:MAG: HAMP domain-containing histidine kinase [Spirochaetales bacterium]|nr:HAMP domain-containing histidine kinase [Spirochaetales bacterium]